MYLAWLRIVDQTNYNVQSVLAKGIPNGKLYRRGLHQAPECIVFLVDYGNLPNDKVTATTWLEVVASTATITAEMNKIADNNGWTRQSLGEKFWADKLFKIPQALFQDGRFPSPNNLELAARFWNGSNKLAVDITDPITRLSRTTNLWEKLTLKTNQEALPLTFGFGSCGFVFLVSF